MKYKEVPNGLGGTVLKLQKYKTVFAELRPVRGREYLEYYKDSNSLVYKITIRYVPDLLPSDVLEYKDRQFQINSIINVEERDYIQEVMCIEKINVKKPEVKDGSV